MTGIDLSAQTPVDIIVVGGGLAGLSAALTATEAGLSVLVLEKQAETGGSSAMSGGCLAFAGTPLQQEAGIEDSAEILYEDLIAVGKGDCDPAIVRAYTDNQLETFHWLVAQGVEFSSVLETASGQSRPRVHNVDPADMIRVLTARAVAAGITIVYEMRVERLLQQDHCVVGVRCTQEGQHYELHASKGVMLACGGFVNDSELIHRFVPHYDEAFFIGGEGNTGDGLRMAWALGADFKDTSYIKGTFGKHPMDETNHHSCLAVYKGAIAVNQDGRRYVDESVSYKLLGDACIKQPYAVTYQILDQAIMDSGENKVRILDFQRRLEEGLFLQADSIEQLARMIEVPEDVLQQEVDDYNQRVASGQPDPLGRTHQVHTYGDLVQIKQAPFYAYPSSVAVYGTYCGLVVDDSMQVKDVFGEPIEGLYAVGEMVGGFHGAAYMTGSALGKATVFGRLAAIGIAARSAAQAA